MQAGADPEEPPSPREGSQSLSSEMPSCEGFGAVPHCLLSEDWRMQAGSGRQGTAKVQ